MLARRTHLLVLITALLLQACRSAAHEPKPKTPAPPVAQASPDPAAEPQPEPKPDDFSLHDEPPVNSGELLEATRHDCCEEAR